MNDRNTDDGEPAAQAHVRLTPEIIARADALAGRLAERVEYMAVRVSRSMVIRLAVLRGLAVLEAENPAEPEAKPKRAR